MENMGLLIEEGSINYMQPEDLWSMQHFLNQPDGSIGFKTISEINLARISELFAKAKIFRYNRNEDLLIEAFDPGDLLIIFSGTVKVISYGEGGKKTALFQLNKLNSGFCEQVYIMTIEPGPVFLITSGNSGIATVSEAIFYEWLTKHQDAMMSTLLYL